MNIFISKVIMLKINMQLTATFVLLLKATVSKQISSSGSKVGQH